MQIKDVEKLKTWLLTKLEPLCDADPAALAKYVVALLRKDKPKSALRELCVDQLEVFLAKETTPFVDRLFRGLDSESYLTGPDSKTPPPQAPPTATPLSSTSKPTTQVSKSQSTKVTPSVKAPPTRPQSVNPPPTKSHSGRARDGTQLSSLSGSGSTSRSGGLAGEKGRTGGGSGDKRHSEDLRSREVDDDDRDFRRSRSRGRMPGDARLRVGRGGGRGGGRGEEGGGTISREPDSSTGGGRKGAESDGSKGRGATVSTSGDHRGKRKRGEGEGPGGGVSSTAGRAGEGGVRRPVKPWQDDRSSHGDNRPSRRSWQHRSRSRSRSSSTDSTSSTTSSSHGHSRKRSRQEWSERGSSRLTPGASGEGGEGTTDGGKKDGSETKKQRCKDYDEKGFCMLGDQCPFDHGIDPVVIGNNIPHSYPPPPSMVAMPSLPLTKPGFLVAGSHSGRVSPTESSTDGYNPEEPGLTATSSPSAPSFLPNTLLNTAPLLPRPFPPPPPPHHHHPPHLPGIPTLPLPPVGPFPPPRLPPPITTASHHFPPPPPHSHSHSHWPRPPHLHPSVPRHPSDTLIVRKIPRESNTITKLSSHFEKFGTIVNLTVWYSGDPEGALVQFSTPFEARKAHDSAEAVLNNRFIKIYYLRKDTPYSTPQLRETTLETPTGVAVGSICGPLKTHNISNSMTDHTSSLTHLTPKPMTATSVSSHSSSLSTPHTHPSHTSHQGTPAPPSLHTTKASNPSSHTYVNTSTATTQVQPANLRKRKVVETPESKEMAKKRLELQKKTGELLQKQIDQQKLLISKLEKGGKQMPTEEKQKIMKTLKSLSTNILKLKNMAAEAMEVRLKSKQAAAQPPPPSPTPLSPTSTSHTLTEKAQALRREAHQLGLISSPSQPISQTTPTSKWMGTGSHVTGSGGGQMKDLRAVLNKKQKSLLVINAESREQLTAHFDAFGGLVKVEVDPDNSKNLIFSFRQAHLAQKAAKHSSMFNGKPLIMKWYTPKAPLSPSSPYSHPPRLTPSQTAQQSAPPSSLSLSTTTTVTPTDGQVTTPTLATPTLTKLDPEELHLVEDDEEEESEERSWRR